MRITVNRQPRLTTSWRAIRLATTLIAVLVASTFVLGSIRPGVRPACCVATNGMTCSSCGLTRSITSLLHGNIEVSRSFHSGGLPIAILVTTLLITRPLPYLIASPKFIALDVSVFLVAWIIVSIAYFGLPGSGYVD